MTNDDFVIEVDFSNLVVPTLADEVLLQQLGRLLVAFNSLEQWLVIFIEEIDHTQALVPGAQFSTLLCRFNEVGTRRLTTNQSACIDDFGDFVHRCRNAGRQRNLFVHSRWYESNGATRLIPGRAGRRGPPEQERREVTPDEIGTVADTCVGLADELCNIWPTRLELED